MPVCLGSRDPWRLAGCLFPPPPGTSRHAVNEGIADPAVPHGRGFLIATQSSALQSARIDHAVIR